MDKSIFSYLVSYVPTNKREAKEDYLTQMFAWILDNVEGVADLYIEYLCTKNHEIPCPPKHERKISISTQETLSTGRIDLLIRVNETMSFICEHKVFSELSENQIQKYMDASGNVGTEKVFSVLVTFSSVQHTQKSDVAIIWSDVCELIETNMKNYINENLFVLKQFVAYLKENGMGKVEPVTPEALLGYWLAMDLENRLTSLFRTVEGYDWINNCLKLLELNSENYNPQFNRTRWGRLGIDFYSEWKPNIFCGVLLHTEDHKLEPVDEKKGPDFVVLLEVDYSKNDEEIARIYNDFISSSWYIERINKLKNNSGSFEFIPGIENSRWRVAVLRKPLFDVLYNAYTREEQVQELIKAMEEGIGLLIG